MAINPESQYPGKIAPATSDYPYGAARNITVPGDGTGTPWEAALVNDLFGFQQALLSEAEIVPTGTPDKVGASQYLNALIGLFDRVVPYSQAALTLDLTRVSRFVSGGYGAAGDGGAARFEFTGTTTPGSAGTEDWANGVIYDVNGREFKIVHDGSIRLTQVGIVGDWNGSSGTNNAARFVAILDFTEVTIFYGAGINARYYFGAIAGDTALKEMTREVLIDWMGAEIIVDGDNSGVFTGTGFIRFVDSPGSMKNYVFDDRNFTFAGPSRGVVPFGITNNSANTAGYEIGPCHIKRGQSILTAFSTDPNNARATDIRLVGPVHADDAYYGVNLANNGDSFSGVYSIDRYNRAIFVYGVKDCEARYHAREGQPSSSNLLISNGGSGTPATRNIKIHAHHEVLNGPMDIVEQPSAGDGAFDNIDVTFIVDSLGVNLTTSDAIVNLGAFDSGGGFLSSGTLSIDRVKLDIRTDIALISPVATRTTSPNYGRIQLLGNRALSGELEDFHVMQGDGSVFRSLGGDTTLITLEVDTKYLVIDADGPGLVRWKLDITAQQDTQFAVGKATIASYDLIGYISGGTLVLQQAVELHKTTQSTPVPTISVTASALKLQVSVSGYASNPGGRISAFVRNLQP